MKLELLGCDSKTNTTLKVIFSEPTTVKDFIFDVLENGGDLGYIVIGEDLSVKPPYCKYEFGKLITALPPKYFFKKIRSAEAHIVLSRTDYILTLEED